MTGNDYKIFPNYKIFEPIITVYHGKSHFSSHVLLSNSDANKNAHQQDESLIC